MSNLESDPTELIYIIRIVDGFADSLELEGYRDVPVETSEPLADGWYRAIPPEYKEDATCYPALDDEVDFEDIPDPTVGGDWSPDF